MGEDRRRYDPFAPHQPQARKLETSAAVTLGGQTVQGFVQAPVSEQRSESTASPVDDLQSLRKAELIQLAERLKVDSSGAKPELIDRIRRAQQSGG